MFQVKNPNINMSIKGGKPYEKDMCYNRWRCGMGLATAKILGKENYIIIAGRTLKNLK